MSWRKLRVLIDYLPEESAYRTALFNAMSPQERAAALAAPESGAFGPWSHLEHLTAAVRDELRDLIWITQLAHRDPKKGKAPERPKPTPRPWLDEAKVTKLSTERRAYLERVRAGHGNPDLAPAETTKEASRYGG